MRSKGQHRKGDESFTFPSTAIRAKVTARMHSRYCDVAKLVAKWPCLRVVHGAAGRLLTRRSLCEVEASQRVFPALVD
jgi:hypothetical protein